MRTSPKRWIAELNTAFIDLDIRGFYFQRSFKQLPLKRNTECFVTIEIYIHTSMLKATTQMDSGIKANETICGKR